MPNETETAPAAVFATDCDLVMKGGITSGIVYPLAVVEIAKAFRLRCIGGTSAGAIAAAAAAAAELGRQRWQQGELQVDPQGFAQLEALPAFLAGQAQDKRSTRLMAFFRPATALKPLFAVFLATLGAKGALQRSWAALLTLAKHHWLALLLGALIGGGPLWWLAGAHWSVVPWMLAGAAIGALIAVICSALRLLLRELPANRFGICSGMGADGGEDAEALTPWLTDYLDGLCGQRERQAGAAQESDRQKPLTFGDLRAHGVELQVMTTCLTMGRPFRLPFRHDAQVRENNQFYFRLTDFQALFPRRVVEWMRRNPRPIAETSNKLEQMDFTGLHPLPVPDDLPVVVAVRMSLSFPILLSAVPLYSVDFHKPIQPGDPLERCWFTDGGVGSNFPIHFFDAALPSRPTFGLNLGVAEDGQQQRVIFPKDNGDARLSWWRRFDERGLRAITGFLANVIHVAKDWNHDTLSHMPGFRDRIGLIQLTRQEGGLNLAMDDALITTLTEYGREAGKTFVKRFGNPALAPAGIAASKMDWANHQRIRLRLLLASLSELLASLESSSQSLEQPPALAAYARFFDPDQGQGSYAFSGRHDLGADAQGHYRTQAGLAQEMLQRMRELAQLIAASEAAYPGVDPDNNAPKPTPELKLRPRI